MQTSDRTFRSERQGGFVLLMVLILLVLAATLGVSYMASSSLKVQAADNLIKASRARYLAESAVQHGFYKLQTDPGGVDRSGQVASGPYYADDSGDGYYFYVDDDAGLAGTTTVTGESSVDGLTQTCSVEVIVGDAPRWSTTHSVIVGNGNAWLPSSLNLTGDLHVNGNLYNLARINGDASATGWIGGILWWISGQTDDHAEHKDFFETTPDDYRTYNIGGRNYTARTLSDDSLDERHPIAGRGAVTPTNPGGVVILEPSGGEVKVEKPLQFEGTLVVDGDLLLHHRNIELVARDGFPALVVTGRVLVKNATDADIDGLVIAYGGIAPSSGSVKQSRTHINGGLITREHGYDLGLGGQHTLTYDEDKCRIYDFTGGRNGSLTPLQIVNWND